MESDDGVMEIRLEDYSWIVALDMYVFTIYIDPKLRGLEAAMMAML
jgi:hypothetical protein